MYNPVDFSVFTRLHYYHNYLTSEHFHHPKKQLHTIRKSLLTPHSSHPLHPQMSLWILPSDLMDLPPSGHLIPRYFELLKNPVCFVSGTYAFVCLPVYHLFIICAPWIWAEFFSQPSQPRNAASQPLAVGVNQQGGAIFLTQGLNLGLLHCRWILYCLSHQGSLYIYTYIYRRRRWQPTPVFLPGKFLGQRSLVDYRPWNCKELDTTEKLTHTHIWRYWEGERGLFWFLICRVGWLAGDPGVSWLVL